MASKHSQLPLGTLETLDVRGPTFRTWSVCSSVLIVKMLVLLLAEGWLEVMYRTFQLPEDEIFSDIVSRKTVFADANRNLDRVRIAQHNCLLNSVPLILAGFLYILSNPDVGRARRLLQVATIARYLHTILLVFQVLPQPARIATFMLPMVITGFMSAHATRYFIFG